MKRRRSAAAWAMGCVLGSAMVRCGTSAGNAPPTSPGQTVTGSTEDGSAAAPPNDASTVEMGSEAAIETATEPGADGHTTVVTPPSEAGTGTTEPGATDSSVAVNPVTGGADASAASLSPTGLLVNLLSHPEHAVLTDSTPKFGWIVNAAGNNQKQTAYRILVSTSATSLAANTGDVWDSGKVASGQSINVVYAGKTLSSGATYLWKVQTWDSAGAQSDWSASQSFVMAASLGSYTTATEAVIETHIAPAQVATVGTGHYFVDFGRDAFGWVELTMSANSASTVEVDIGEKATGQSVDPNPGASIRYAKSSVTLQAGTHTYRVATPKDAVNTKTPPAIAIPASLGVIIPFRYVEIVNSPVAITAASVSQVAVTYPYDNSASSFTSSNTTLDNVWNMSKYTMLATTFAGIYVDGDRERTPYEGDAYLHELGHYSVDRQFALARYSHEYLLTHPTWPTEWKQHSIMMAWMDWMYTGNTDALAQAYTILTSEKLLEQNVGSDGLLNTGSLRDLVDWPTNERDGFVLTAVDTVVNAFYCRNLQQMADIATALGKTADATKYASMATAAIATFNQKLFNTATGLYVDGETTTHSSLHANMFPLALGIVPANRKVAVTTFVKSRNMACSVYGAQYLLEALYSVGEADAALALLTADTLTSWTNMMKVGSTMTLEAWDVSIKPNLDWNHSWGAAPANIVARQLLGIQPTTPGFATATIHPQPGSLSHVDGTVPTIRGPIRVVTDVATGTTFTTTVTLPANMTADIAVPSPAGATCNPVLDGQTVTAVVKNGTSWVASVGSGTHVVHCQ